LGTKKIDAHPSFIPRAFVDDSVSPPALTRPALSLLAPKLGWPASTFMIYALGWHR